MLEIVNVILLLLVIVLAFSLANLSRNKAAPTSAAPPAPHYWRKLSEAARIFEQLETTAREAAAREEPALAFHMRLPCEPGGPSLYAYAQGEELCFELLAAIEKQQHREPRSRRLVCACGLAFVEMEDLRRHQAECDCQEHTA